MYKKEFQDAELYLGHLKNHIGKMTELNECLLFRSKEDKNNMQEILNILNYVMSTLEGADNIREIGRVMDMNVLSNKFDFVMNELASTPRKHSDMVDAISELERNKEGE